MGREYLERRSINGGPHETPFFYVEAPSYMYETVHRYRTVLQILIQQG
jgi:hypothetical protein